MQSLKSVSIRFMQPRSKMSMDTDSCQDGYVGAGGRQILNAEPATGDAVTILGKYRPQS